MKFRSNLNITNFSKSHNKENKKINQLRKSTLKNNLSDIYVSDNNEFKGNCFMKFDSKYFDIYPINFSEK